MQPNRLWIATTLAVFAAVLGPGPSAHADARRTGLAGSLLIEDRDDIYFFPQRLIEHANLIALSYGGSGASGSGLLTLGSGDSVFGLAVHRGDVQSPHTITPAAALSGPSSRFGGAFAVAPATVIDLLWGTKLSGADLGVRLSLGHGKQSTTVADLDSGESDTFITGELGYGWGERGRDTRVDLSGVLGLDFASREAADTDALSGTFFGFSGLLRAFMPMDSAIDLGILANLGVARTAIADDALPGDPAASELGFDLGAGIGPALSFGRVSVAGYAVLGLRIANTDPDGDTPSDDSTTHTLVIPGVHMAVEVPLTDWFFVRTGAQYSFNMRGVSQPGDSGSANSDGTFGWNAGLGVVVDQFRFDGSLQQGFVTGGPDFIGGTGAGFLALATLSYSFDQLRHRATPAAAPRFVPAEPPPPEPDAPPPPVVEEPSTPLP